MLIRIESSIFTGQFRDAFASTGMSPELIQVLVWVLGTAGIIVLLGLLIQIIRMRLHPRQPIDQIQAPRAIIDLLGKGLAERSRFEISFQEKIIKTQGIYCTLVSVDRDEILLELPDYARSRQAWINHPLEVYFSVASDSQSRIYYTFESVVSALDHDQADHHVYLHIPLPASIRLGQRRMHFRLVPDPSTILEAKLWFAPHQDRTHDHAGPGKWGPPMAHHHMLPQDDPEPSLTVRDLSAGGCRIAIRNNKEINAYLDTDRSPDVLLFFRLLDREAGHLEVYLLGRIRVIVCDPLSTTRSLGIEFTMTGQVAGSTGQYITWSPLSREEGHPEIGNWVFKQHLALFRKREKEREEAELEA
jgi:c-di-GMP-binding flagellar brake protein YcgR